MINTEDHYTLYNAFGLRLFAHPLTHQPYGSACYALIFFCKSAIMKHPTNHNSPLTKTHSAMITITMLLPIVLMFRMSPFTAVWSAWATPFMHHVTMRRLVNSSLISDWNKPDLMRLLVQVRQLLQSMDASDLVSGCLSRWNFQDKIFRESFLIKLPESFEIKFPGEWLPVQRWKSCSCRIRNSPDAQVRD